MKVKVMKIYLAVCCLNRPFDNQTQTRIHLEAEAILSIIQSVDDGEWEWISSEAVAYEINRTPNEERQERLWSLESRSTKRLQLTDSILQQARQLQRLGFTSYDALHLTFATAAEVDVFLTTDDKLLKRAQGYRKEIKIPVANPLSWLQEVMI
ncbi:MAG: PIN domain-containing protein [Chloroflexota bacterium]